MEHSNSPARDLFSGALEMMILESLHRQPDVRTLRFGSDGVGILIGLGTAAAIARLMRTLLFGISPLDPFSFTAVPLILAAAAVLASFLPARRITSLSSVDALRVE